MLLPLGDGRKQEEVSTPYLLSLERSGDFQMPGVSFPISQRFSDLKIITHPTSNSSTNLKFFGKSPVLLNRTHSCSPFRALCLCPVFLQDKNCQSLIVQLHSPSASGCANVSAPWNAVVCRDRIALTAGLKNVSGIPVFVSPITIRLIELELSLCCTGKKVSQLVKPGFQEEIRMLGFPASRTSVPYVRYCSGSPKGKAISLKGNTTAKEERGMPGDLDAISNELAK